MYDDAEFVAWVAKAIFDISGIWPQQACGSQRKCFLTCARERMSACQVVFGDYFDPVNLGDMRLSARVLANFTLAGRKPH